FEKAANYHAGAVELSSAARGAEPHFTDKEKMNLEIYAERQNDPRGREEYLDLARGHDSNASREVSVAPGRSK
ncbi:MAG TPA: hypothetical protein VIW67_08595, partial [Terriglobales bacterium]